VSPLLRVEGLVKAFGELRAVDGVSFEVEAGPVTCIIGPNGAGKTTLVNLLTGRLLPDRGRVLFGGLDITWAPAHARVRLGLSRSFQINSVFPQLTVAENVAVPILARRGQSAVLGRPAWAVAGLAEEVGRVLAEWRLEPFRDAPASSLSHGTQRLLEIAIAMATRPRLLFLDEPTAGLSPGEKPQVLAELRRVASAGETTFVLIEHDMDIVFSLADRIIVMHRGRILADGAPAAIRDDRGVQEVYLGAALGAQASPARAGEAAGAPQLLVVAGLNTFYGQSHVLHDVSLTVREGEVVGLLGRNGAGKTTTLRSLIGLTPPRSGRVLLAGKPIAGLPPHAIAASGVGYVPEDRRIFRDLTVTDNLLVAQRAQEDRAGGPWSLDRVWALFPDLRALARLRGDQLSGGQQKMLAIARALMGNPRLLLLDEPSEGLAPGVVRTLAETLRKIRDEGVAILLAEQNAVFAALVADRVYVLENGRIQMEESGAVVRAHPEVLQRYLAVEGTRVG
jgi:branched-chain amino acid transport system ATP-binding protein